MLLSNDLFVLLYKSLFGTLSNSSRCTAHSPRQVPRVCSFELSELLTTSSISCLIGIIMVCYDTSVDGFSKFYPSYGERRKSVLNWKQKLYTNFKPRSGRKMEKNRSFLQHVNFYPCSNCQNLKRHSLNNKLSYY